MRKLLLCLCGLGWASQGWAQQADSLAPAPKAAAVWWVNSSTSAAGECTEVLTCDSLRGVVRIFYPSGRLKSYTSFMDIARCLPFGVATTWYENGQLWTQQAYQAGRREGELLVYYPDGALKRRSSYVEGKEQIGSCFALDGQPIGYSVYEQTPLYPGGEAMLQKDVVRQLRQYCRECNDQYVLPRTLPVKVLFKVAEDGSIHDPELVNLPALTKAMSTYWGTDMTIAILKEKVLETLRHLPRPFTPGWRDGQVVTAYYQQSVNIAFLPLCQANKRTPIARP
ncbi:hypothetical protein GO988_05645 [Hymenobacter sp. HMF4947]|uniref:Toxin-antitoxin system YwqK family antitoxin n=1 Tax=Hymenobacter ginkgonis TaxID=2682976 RepID=A0A7K1TBN9_9BACT|nr:hypothetical protein [Hymenobacter ginkgonis]MVN75805.1 hypothetical protein [Hymenobacter ginkgonis]